MNAEKESSVLGQWMGAFQVGDRALAICTLSVDSNLPTIGLMQVLPNTGEKDSGRQNIPYLTVEGKVLEEEGSFRFEPDNLISFSKSSRPLTYEDQLEIRADLCVRFYPSIADNLENSAFDRYILTAKNITLLGNGPFNIQLNQRILHRSKPLSDSKPRGLEWPLEERVSWSEFREWADKAKIDGWVFRGLEKASHSLETTLSRQDRYSIFRYLSGDLIKALKKIREEKSKVRDAGTQPLDFPEFQWELEADSDERQWLQQLRSDPTETIRLTRWLRHYGFPAPILDWSRNPYVSSYFAVGSAASSDLENEDFVVYAYHHGHLMKLLEGLDPGHEDLLHPANLIRWRDPDDFENRLPGRETNQEAVYLWTSLRDLEGFIRWIEAQKINPSDQCDPSKRVLRRFRLSASERGEFRDFLEREGRMSLFELYGDEDHLVEDLTNQIFRKTI